MPVNRRLRAVRLAEAMARYGIARDEGISFGSARIKGHGVTVQSVADSFMGGDTITALATFYDLTRAQVENAIRFYCLYPKSDLPSFWNDERTKGYEEHL